MRPVMWRSPSESIAPTSPECSQPCGGHYIYIYIYIYIYLPIYIYIGDVEESVRVDRANVARVEPALWGSDIYIYRERERERGGEREREREREREK